VRNLRGRRRSRAVAAALLLAGTSACGGGQNPAAEGTSEETVLRDGEGVLGEWVASGGLARTYSLRVPPSYDGSHPCPLVLAFHGAGGDGGVAEYVGLDRAAERAGFILASPDGVGRSWALGCGGCTVADSLGVDDVYFVEVLVAHLSSHLSIDRSRVFAAGLSDGGTFTNRVACEYPVAAAAVVAGTLFNPASCRPERPVSMMAFHGTRDDVIPFNHGASPVRLWASLDGCGEEPTVIPLPDLADDGTTVWRYEYPACRDATEVVFFALEGGRHSWPGAPSSEESDIQASQEIVDFFSRHRRLP
jgi:polyhydroxybutyrate depolymerase